MNGRIEDSNGVMAWPDSRSDLFVHIVGVVDSWYGLICSEMMNCFMSTFVHTFASYFILIIRVELRGKHQGPGPLMGSTRSQNCNIQLCYPPAAAPERVACLALSLVGLCRH